MKYSKIIHNNILFYLLVFICLLSSKATYCSDSTSIIKASTPILFIGHFNHDQYLDTVYGAKVSNIRFLPKWIVFGKNVNDSLTPDLDRIKKINYPKFDSLSGVYVIDKLNKDTLFDIEYYFKGKFKDSSLINKVPIVRYRDTSSTIILFGQNQFSNTIEINLDSIPRLLTYPVYALRIDDKIDYASKTHLNNIEWCVKEQKPIDVIIPEQHIVSQNDSTFINNKDIQIKKMIQSAYFTTYPNPANKTIFIKYENIVPSILKVYISDINGNSMFNKKYYIRDCLIQEFDISSYSSGSYAIKILDEFDNLMYQTNFIVVK